MGGVTMILRQSQFDLTSTGLLELSLAISFFLVYIRIAILCWCSRYEYLVSVESFSYIFIVFMCQLGGIFSTTQTKKSNKRKK